jgi:hypothetical protein
VGNPTAGRQETPVITSSTATAHTCKYFKGRINLIIMIFLSATLLYKPVKFPVSATLNMAGIWNDYVRSPTVF